MRPGFVFKVPKYYLTISVLRQPVLVAATGLKISFKTVDRVFRRHQIKHKKKGSSRVSGARNRVRDS